MFNLAHNSSTVPIVDRITEEDLEHNIKSKEIIFVSDENTPIIASLQNELFNTLSFLSLNSGGDCL
jgi:hypothetical protein